MMKINLGKFATNSTKVRNTPSKTLSRAHYINFLKEEDKFMKASEKLSKRIDEWSLKAIPNFFTSIKHFTIMGSEKLKSFYYLHK